VAECAADARHQRPAERNVSARLCGGLPPALTQKLVASLSCSLLLRTAVGTASTPMPPPCELRQTRKVAHCRGSVRLFRRSYGSQCSCTLQRTRSLSLAPLGKSYFVSTLAVRANPVECDPPSTLESLAPSHSRLGMNERTCTHHSECGKPVLIERQHGRSIRRGARCMVAGNSSSRG
jgi:hypothetical protein